MNTNELLKNIPEGLRKKKQWVCWQQETDEKGKSTKIPYVAKEGFQKKASTTNSDDWKNDRLAAEICQKQKFNGIGFVFTQDDPYCGIDLDHSIDEAGNIEIWAADLLTKFNSYSEKSPSGRGIHIIAKAKLPGSGTKKELPGYPGTTVEIYDQGRYFTMTGNVLEGYDTIQERQGDVDWLYTVLNPPKKAEPTVKTFPKHNMTNDQILKKIRRSKQAEKFNQLWTGDLAGYPSQSEADLALCSILAFYTQDEKQILSIVQDSKLWDEKWEREDYQERTIGKALEGLTDRYAKQYQSSIFLKAGCYYARRKLKNGNHETIQISNFSLNLKRSISTPEEVVRQVVLTGADGTESTITDLKAGSMVTPIEFKKFSLRCGNYFFNGKAGELDDLLEAELAKSQGLIYQPDRIGYIADGKFWLFGNLAVAEGGGVVYPDPDGIIWLNGRGYMPISFEAQEGSEALPVVSIKNDIREYKKALLDNIYNNIELPGLLGLGWCASHAYMPELVKQYRCFPELFIYGKLKAGKNTFGRWLMNFFGLSATEKTISETSQNWISRALSYYSGCPVWLDEYRNEKKVKEKNGVLRNGFDRIGAGKGQIGFGGAGYPVRGSVILSGQSLPDDNALLTRCLILRLSRQNRDDTYLETVNKLSGDMSAVLVDLVRHKTPESVENVLKAVGSHEGKLRENQIEDRDAVIYAIVLGGLELLAEDVYSQAELDVFIHAVYEGEAQRDKTAKEEESELSIFWADIGVLIAEGRIPSSSWKFIDSKLYIWFTQFYNVWAEYYRRRTGDTAFSKSAILDYIHEESYFIKKDVPFLLNGKTTRCLYLDFSLCPAVVKECFETVIM